MLRVGDSVLLNTPGWTCNGAAGYIREVFAFLPGGVLYSVAVPSINGVLTLGPKCLLLPKQTVTWDQCMWQPNKTRSPNS